MAQPTLSGLELNAGSGGSELLHDVIDGDVAQVVLVGYSTGDGTLNVVMTDAPLPVDIRAENASVTVDQATAANLNMTEASAAAIKTAVQIMDDWDESDRAKVNPIAGQAGIAAGSGAVDALTPRVILATDDPAVALLGTIDADTGSILTALQIMDDWDESDRAKVNPIAGQAGIAAGSGAVDALTPRVILATDDPAVALLGTIDADTGAIKTAVELLDNAIAGSEMQVDVVAPLPAGSNAIGKLAANDGVDIGDVDVASIAAGTNTIGGAIAQQSSSVAYDGTTACTIKRATGLAASGTVAMVAAVEGYQIRVLAIALIATSTTVTNIYVANGDHDILGDSSNPIPLGVDADGDMMPGLVLPYNPAGWFQTDTDNEALNIVLSAAQDVIYAVTYIEVT